MKLLLALLCLAASTAWAEQATLAANTVLRTANSLVILKAGTTVQVLARNDKTVTVKYGDKTGQISSSALESFSDADMMSAPRTAPVAPAPAPAPTPAEPRKAQTMYGKAVEKAAAAAGTHEKTLVEPTDEILGGK